MDAARKPEYTFGVPDDAFTLTRRQLRGIAENLIAGPQYRATGTIRLAVRPSGFSGTAIAEEVQGTDIVWPEGRAALTGTLNALAESTGLPIGPPEGVYEISDPLDPDEPLALDPAAVDQIYLSLYAGGQALVEFAPDQHPVLWPEHFDVAVTVEEVNYGVSAGDSYHERPYAYVGPWTPRTGQFWNAPFGAVLGLDLTTPEPDLVAAITRFFEQGRAHL